MNRQRLVRAALRAYPQSERGDLGAEMEGTILDAGPTKRRTFARELIDLTRFGLVTRATGVAGAGTARVLADGVCRGATWIMMLDLSTMAVWRQQRAVGSGALTEWWSIAVITATLALALYGFDRIAGIGALAWMFARTPELASVTTPAHWLPPTALVIACFLVMVLYPRRRERDVRRLGWLLVPVWVFAVIAAGRDGGLSVVVLLLVVLLVAGAAIASLPTDPRLAIAATLPISYLGLGVAHRGDPITFVFVAAAPIVLCLAAFRSYRLRTRAPI